MGKEICVNGLILASLDEAAFETEVPAQVWERVKQMLRSDLELYANLINYWTLGNDCDEFAIPSCLRSL
jgi:hypothetical protein